MPATPVRPDSHRDLCLVRDRGLPDGHWFSLSFPLDAGGVLCSGFPISTVSGQASGCVGNLAEQFVEPGGLAFRLRVNGKTGLRPASWRSVAAYAAAPVFLAVITDRVIAVICQHILPQDTQSAWAPLGHTTLAGLRLMAVVALYLLRVLLAPSETLRGLRRMVLDAAPIPEMTPIRPASSEPLPRPGHDHRIQEQGLGQPSETGTPPRTVASTGASAPVSS